MPSLPLFRPKHYIHRKKKKKSKSKEAVKGAPAAVGSSSKDASEIPPNSRTHFHFGQIALPSQPAEGGGGSIASPSSVRTDPHRKNGRSNQRLPHMPNFSCTPSARPCPLPFCIGFVHHPSMTCDGYFSALVDGAEADDDSSGDERTAYEKKWDSQVKKVEEKNAKASAEKSHRCVGIAEALLLSVCGCGCTRGGAHEACECECGCGCVRAEGCFGEGGLTFPVVGIIHPSRSLRLGVGVRAG